MGLKKSGKRLLKLGQKGARELGKGGKAWVEKVFETARSVIEDELKTRAKEHGRGRSAGSPPQPEHAAKGSTTAAKKPTMPAAKRGTPSTKRAPPAKKRATPAPKRSTPAKHADRAPIAASVEDNAPSVVTADTAAGTAVVGSEIAGDATPDGG